MELDIDVKERSVAFEAPKSLYSREGLGITAHIFSSRAEVYLGESAKSFELTLKARRKDAGKPELEALAGEFANELLNQEYRFLVSSFNSKVSGLIVAQTLLCARGGEEPPKAPDAEKSPEFLAEVAKLMADAQKEVERTMPRKLPPQGNPLPPAREDSLA